MTCLMPLALSCLPACAAPAKGELTLYVSPAGNDDWSGKLPEPNRAKKDGPFLTPARALEAVREARASGNAGTVTVLLREGTYALSAPLSITPAHGGTAEGPTVIAAYPGERPLISGGRRISGWRDAGDGVWQVEVPEVKSGQWAFRNLWVNRERRKRTRLPKEGLYALAGGAQPEQSAFQYAPDHLRADWASRDDIEVVVLQYWTEARLHIAKLDEANRVVTFTGGSWRPLTWSMGYYVENVREAPLEPGQWYLDRPSGVLSYRPLPGEDLTKAEVIAPVADQLVQIRDTMLISDRSVSGQPGASSGNEYGEVVSKPLVMGCADVPRVADRPVWPVGGRPMSLARPEELGPDVRLPPGPLRPWFAAGSVRSCGRQVGAASFKSWSANSVITPSIRCRCTLA